MDVNMSSVKPGAWFTELDEDDPIMLQEFVGDCLVDYPLEEMAAVMREEVHHTRSCGSECNSSTANSTLTNASAEYTGSGARGATVISTKRPKRLPDQCHNHIIAERQRRQNLSQRFIALSALIPGLKKMDKTTVLGEAINYMKQLKERLKILEEENARRAIESVVVVKRSQMTFENESNSSSICNDNNIPTTSHDHQLPEIEARFSNKSVLIKIHCGIQKGILVKIINEIESLHLSITSTNTMPFNARTLDITIVAEMESSFDMRPQDVVRHLRSIF